ncbi:MAG TPA: glycosyltransferase [Jatrophihabitans sp.]|nr:glycosyltransferase [Jatrophihabitans sp.]
MTGRLVALGSTLALAGALHAARNARLLRRPPPPPARTPPVSVLVPARDEEADITACVASSIGQPGVRELIVLDDGSADATAQRARQAGARVLLGAPMPSGWLGKPWACAQLAAAADPACEILVFVDADVRLEPGALARAVALLEAAGLDVICPFPRQEAGGMAERLVQPLLQWSWLTTLPLRIAERSPRPSLTAACGQFVVVRRAALQRAGGHAAVRGEVLDDIALVRAIKAAGGRGGVVDGSTLARCRMYRGWPELRDGYAKSLWSAFGSPAGAAAVLAGLGLAYVLPPLAALRGSRAGMVGYAAAVASRVVAARACGGRMLPDAAGHPVSIVLFGYLTARSFTGHRRGTLRWKGRPLAAEER